MSKIKLKGKKKQLNLESFNDILFQALKDQSIDGKIELLEKEMEMVGGMIYDLMAEIMDELKEKGYRSEKFDKLLTIKKNTEPLIVKLQELKLQKMKDEIDQGAAGTDEN